MDLFLSPPKSFLSLSMITVDVDDLFLQLMMLLTRMVVRCCARSGDVFRGDRAHLLKRLLRMMPLPQNGKNSSPTCVLPAFGQVFQQWHRSQLCLRHTTYSYALREPKLVQDRKQTERLKQVESLSPSSSRRHARAQ